MENTKVLEILRQCGSMLEGHFLLSSGKHSDRYFQCAKLLEHPALAAQVFEIIAAQAKELRADVVVGPAMGGIIPAYELARQLDIRAVFTEREDGEMTLRRGFTLEKGMRVIIAEDVVTTGKSTLETVRVIESYGAEVVALTCIVDRRGAGNELPFPVLSATTADVAVFDPTDCKLCNAGSAPVKPGSRVVF